jgi:cell division protein FtsL
VTTEEKYVAAVYVVVLLVVLIYVLLMAAKISRLGRDVEELTELVRERRQRGEEPLPKPAPKQVKVG